MGKVREEDQGRMKKSLNSDKWVPRAKGPARQVRKGPGGGSRWGQTGEASGNREQTEVGKCSEWGLFSRGRQERGGGRRARPVLGGRGNWGRGGQVQLVLGGWGTEGLLDRGSIIPLE